MMSMFVRGVVTQHRPNLIARFVIMESVLLLPSIFHMLGNSNGNVNCSKNDLILYYLHFILYCLLDYFALYFVMFIVLCLLNYWIYDYWILEFLVNLFCWAEAFDPFLESRTVGCKVYKNLSNFRLILHVAYNFLMFFVQAFTHWKMLCNLK